MSNLILNPWSSLDNIFNDFNRAFGHKTAESYPPVQTHQDENGIELRFELPGVDPDKVVLHYEDDTLTIKGSRESVKEEKTDRFIRKERHSGSFERSFVLPWKVDEEKVHARYKHGVLTVSIPKEAAQKPKRISIQTKGVA